MVTNKTTPGYRCREGENVFDAARRLYGNFAIVDVSGTLPQQHPSWECLGTVTVRPQEAYYVYKIPEAVNPSLYKTS